jgi:hypothetical protein
MKNEEKTRTETYKQEEHSNDIRKKNCQRSMRWGICMHAGEEESFEDRERRLVSTD